MDKKSEFMLDVLREALEWAIENQSDWCPCSTLCNTEQFLYYTDNGWCSSRMNLRYFDTFDHACQFATKLADDLPAHHCISIYSAQNQKMTTMYGQR